MRALSAEKTIEEDPVRLSHWRRVEDRIVLMPRLRRRSITRDVPPSKVFTESSLAAGEEFEHPRFTKDPRDWSRINEILSDIL